MNSPKGRGIPTQIVILALVAVLVLPGSGFTALLMQRYAKSEQERYGQDGIGIARAASALLDRHVISLQTALKTLSVSALLAADDIEGFHRQASRVKEFIGADIGVRSLAGQQLANTRVAWGTALPATPFEVDATAIQRGEPVATDIFVGAIANRPLIAIILAVKVDGRPKYLLHISAETDRFYEAIKGAIPAEWLIGVADRRGVYITRSENHAEFTGKPGVPAYLARMHETSGSFRGENAFGEEVVVGYTHSALTGWVIAANIKESLVAGPMREAVMTLVAWGAALLIMASVIALWLWRFISRPLDILTSASGAVGSMNAPIAMNTHLKEFRSLGKALSAANEQIRSSRERLEEKVEDRTKELAEANQNLTSQMLAREKAEDQLRQIHKMEAIGQLAGGIAHDFNNMLAIIVASLSLAKKRIERREFDIARFIDGAMDGADRAASLTRRLLAFSRQQPLAPEVVDVNRLLNGMSELLQRSLGESIRVETVIAGGLWNVHVDGSQLENSILNLAVNSRDAMPEGGRLKIETSNAYLDEIYAGDHPGLKAGQYVLIAISDTGHGMSNDVRERAFDPFYTTKQIGAGTGLGLSQVYGFVKQSKGHLALTSEVGKGTTLKIYLPRYCGAEPTKASDAVPAVRQRGSGQLILLVEDEERLRALSAEALAELGYRVLQAGHATEALQILGENPDIALLFTDVVMPDISGRKLADEALRRRPSLRVLYTTGFSRDAIVHNGVLDVGVDMIAKPYSIEDLAAKVSQVLIQPRASKL